MSELTLAPPLVGRCLRISMRQIDALFTAVALPIMMMLMFVYLFGGALHVGMKYVTYVVPGVLLVCAAFGAAMTAVSVSHDLNGGIMDRFRAMDVPATSIIGGHVVASVLRNTFSTALVFGVAFAVGFRSSADAGRWLAALGVLMAFVFALSWLSAAIGLLAKSPESANGFTFFVSFVPYLSSAFVPIATMPSWLHGVAGHQPATPVADSVRGLLLDRPVGDDPWIALAWSGGMLVCSMVLSAMLFRRRTG